MKINMNFVHQVGDQPRLRLKRLIYCISTADITGTEFQNRACYNVLVAAMLFSTAVCVYMYVFLVLLVVYFLVTAESENKHISFHLMYFR